MSRILAAKDKETGKTILISDLTEERRGKESDCFCAECKTDLIANMGDINRHFFSHKSQMNDRVECSETALHLLGKSVISRANKISLSELIYKLKIQSSFGINFTSDTIHSLSGLDTLQINESIEEKAIKGIQADVYSEAFFNGTFAPINFEIFVNHKVDDDKLKKIQRLNLTTIEIDISHLLKSDLSMAEIQREILNPKNFNLIHLSKLVLPYESIKKVEEFINKVNMFDSDLRQWILASNSHFNSTLISETLVHVKQNSFNISSESDLMEPDLIYLIDSRKDGFKEINKKIESDKDYYTIEYSDMKKVNNEVSPRLYLKPHNADRLVEKPCEKAVGMMNNTFVSDKNEEKGVLSKIKKIQKYLIENNFIFPSIANYLASLNGESSSDNKYGNDSDTVSKKSDSSNHLVLVNNGHGFILSNYLGVEKNILAHALEFNFLGNKLSKKVVLYIKTISNKDILAEYLGNLDDSYLIADYQEIANTLNPMKLIMKIKWGKNIKALENLKAIRQK